MIIYRYKLYNQERELCINDDGPAIMRCNTDEEEAYLFVKQILEPKVKKILGESLDCKRFLDVGMGNGNVLKCVQQQLGVDVFGVDIANYLYNTNYKENRTFINMDIRELPEELLGTFDVVYQRLFSVPFKDTLSVLYAISKSLKHDGIYLVTFDDEEYEHYDSFIISILKELYKHVEVTKLNGLIKCCVAYEPIINPKLTPMEEYYYLLSEEEYYSYRKADLKEREDILANKKISI